MRIHLVGGAVRDLLLGRPQGDRDYLVLEASPDQFLARYPTARPVGKSFPIFILDGHEYAWPRGASLKEDLARRDLTINALALDLSLEFGAIIHAHPQALLDLQARILRPASDTALSDDPVRVFRAARFAAQLPDFSLSPELLAQMRQAGEKGLLAGHAPERVGREVLKALEAPKPGRFITMLAWFAERAQAQNIPAGPVPYHHEDVLTHAAQVMDKLAGDPLAAWMGLTHDLGKALTPPESWPSHHGHDRAGQEPAKNLAERLRLPGRFIQAGQMASALHMLAKDYPQLRPGTAVDLLLRLEAKRLTTKMFRLVKADCGLDHLAQARRDLRAILKVKLPEDKRDLGEASGEALRLARCEVWGGMRKTKQGTVRVIT